jgi:hypothetical protein
MALILIRNKYFQNLRASSGKHRSLEGCGNECAASFGLRIASACGIPMLAFCGRAQTGTTVQMGPGLETRAHHSPVKIKTLLVGKSGHAGFNAAAEPKSIKAGGPDMPRVAVGVGPMVEPGAGRRTLALTLTLARIDDDRKILHRSLHQFLRTVPRGGVKE